MFQRLTFADSSQGVALNFSNQPNDAQRLRSVLLDPPRKILECR